MTPSGVEQIHSARGVKPIVAVTETMTPSGVEQPKAVAASRAAYPVTETMTPSGVEQRGFVMEWIGGHP